MARLGAEAVAAAALVGQNLGAQKPERAERAVWLTGFSNMLFLVVVAVVFIVFAGPLVRIFTREPAVIVFAVDCLRCIAYGYGLYAFGMVMVQAFNGGGDTLTPAYINLFCYWLFQVPLAHVLAMPFEIGAQGVFVAITSSESVVALVSVVVFRRGRWKLQQVRLKIDVHAVELVFGPGAGGPMYA